MENQARIAAIIMEMRQKNERRIGCTQGTGLF